MGEEPYTFHTSQEQQDCLTRSYSSRSGHHSDTEPTLDPARILRNGQDAMLPNTSAPEYSFVHPASQQHSQGQVMTPCSAVGSEADFFLDQYLFGAASDELSQVSSFNLPAHYDSSLMTPVSSTGSPSFSTRADSLAAAERDVKPEPQLSPAAFSNFQLYPGEDQYGNRSSQFMKSKRPSSAIHIPSIDSDFPTTVAPPEPYFGLYGVSGTSSMATPPSITYSPSLNSAGSLTSYHSNHTPPLSATSAHGYRPFEHAPILLAPNPSNLRPTSKKSDSRRRHRSVPSQNSRSPRAAYSAKVSTPKSDGSLSPPQSRKKKGRVPHCALENLVIPDDLPDQDRILLELTIEGHEWKEIARLFAAATGQHMKPAALQMRKKRLVDRIGSEQPQTSNSWDETPKDRFVEHVPKYADAPRQTSSPRNWVDSRSTLNTFSLNQAYSNGIERLVPAERVPRNTWSNVTSPNPLHSAHSTSSMDETRARALLDATSQYEGQRQEHSVGYAYSQPQEPKVEGQGGQEHRRNW